MLQKTKYILIGIFIAALGLWGLAVTIPNSFSSGEVVSAAKMNQNFQALKSAVDQLESKVAALETAKATLETKVAALEANWDNLPTRQGYPRAYVSVDDDGSIFHQFSTTGATISVSHPITGRYDIDFGDEHIYYQNDPVSVVPMSDGRVCRSSSVNNDLLVYCQDLSGNPADSEFWVILFNDGS